MIIFVGGLIGAGKSTIAKGLASHFGFPYFDVDEIKKVVYRNDPDYEKNLRDGIPFSDETRTEVFRLVCNDLETLVNEFPHIVVDETLHKRETRQFLYDEARRIAGGFIVVWVHADEDLILARLGGKKREGHLLDDPLPMHNMLRKEFENYKRCIIDCPNNETPEAAIADLVSLIETMGSLSQHRPGGDQV
jgi:gluconate kinase